MDKERASTVPTICAKLDGFVTRIGRAVSWLNLALVVLILVQVVLRYVFGRGLVALEELQWHLYAVLIMVGMSYGLTSDSHIRLDVLHRTFPERRKELVELCGILLLLLPLVVILFLHGVDFVDSSFRVNERSDSPLGLPWRWAIKSVIPASMALLGVSAVSRAIRALSILVRRKQANG